MYQIDGDILISEDTSEMGHAEQRVMIDGHNDWMLSTWEIEHLDPTAG